MVLYLRRRGEGKAGGVYKDEREAAEMTKREGREFMRRLGRAAAKIRDEAFFKAYKIRKKK